MQIIGQEIGKGTIICAMDYQAPMNAIRNTPSKNERCRLSFQQVWVPKRPKKSISDAYASQKNDVSSSSKTSFIG